ncbi:MAG TPA: peptide chain release factor N(5)-glutamine methyltransferase [bacterium]|nr:peptide chain release factor N(5)-glutamine methyltransferase [bacterium]
MNRPPTAPEALRAAEERLKAAGVASPRADAELLLARRLGVERHGLYAGADLDETSFDCFTADVERRARREPLQLILGETEFYGIRLEVRPGVFIPRPETEALVGLALDYLTDDAGLAYDLGCGCGNIACALAVNRVNLRLIATDTSAEAVELTKENAALCGVGERVAVVQADLAAGLLGKADLVCCNPPYVPAGEIPGLEPEVRDHDPGKALDGGEDGLAVIRRLAGTLGNLIKPDGLALVEIGDGQGEAVRRIFSEIAGVEGVEIRKDLAGRQRVAVVRL